MSQHLSHSAVVVLHEIYGINRHILEVCAHYRFMGLAVYCPNLTGRKQPFSPDEHEMAYAGFMKRGGFASASGTVSRLVENLKARHRFVFLAGYSIGGTLAWLAAAATPCDGIVCHYATRIRDYSHLRPRCPALLIMAAGDATFPPGRVRKMFAGEAGIDLVFLDAGHGFCNPDGKTHAPAAAGEALALARRFMGGIRLQ